MEAVLASIEVKTVCTDWHSFALQTLRPPTPSVSSGASEHVLTARNGLNAHFNSDSSNLTLHMFKMLTNGCLC